MKYLFKAISMAFG